MCLAMGHCTGSVCLSVPCPLTWGTPRTSFCQPEAALRQHQHCAERHQPSFTENSVKRVKTWRRRSEFYCVSAKFLGGNWPPSTNTVRQNTNAWTAARPWACGRSREPRVGGGHDPDVHVETSSWLLFPCTAVHAVLEYYYLK